MQDGTNECWRVDDLIVDAGRQTVARNGAPIALGHLSFQFLLSLIRAAPRPLSVDQLMEQVWTGVYVNDETVTQRAKLLRNALGDDPKAPRYFQIRRGVGYQLVPPAISFDGTRSAERRERNGPSRRMVVAGGAAATAAAGIGSWAVLRSRAQTPSRRIAVLPFANLSGDPAQAYFADGMAEELRSTLSDAGLTVVGRTSSEAVRDADARTAARKLEVATLLTGSVRRSPTTIRVNAQLVDGTDGVERWSQVYDRPSGDTLQIQSDIAARVAEALSADLVAPARGSRSNGGTSNAVAQDLILKARSAYLRDDSTAGLQHRLGLIDAALSIDPRYADAHSERAVSLLGISFRNVSSAARAREIRADAEASARRSVAIAPRYATAHLVLAFVLLHQIRVRPAMAELAIADSLAGAHRDDFAVGSWAYAVVKRPAAALQRANAAIARDPLNPGKFENRIRILFWARRYAEADASARQAIALAPGLVQSRGWHGLILTLLGKFEEAKAEFDRVHHEGGPWRVWEALLAFRRGEVAESNRILARVQEAMGDSGACLYAEVYAQQGRKDEAIAALETGWRTRHMGLLVLQVNPLLDPLRGDPRFEAIVKRVDFPA